MNQQHFNNTTIIPSTNLPLPNIIARASAFSFLIVTGIVGNVFFLVVYGKYRPLQIPMNYFLVNLAITDILAAIFRELPVVLAYVYQGWPFDHQTCEFVAVLRCFCYVCTMFTLFAISICRYLVIVHSLGKKFTRRVIVVILAVIWTYSFVDCSLPVMGWSRYVYQSSQYQCSVDWLYQSSYATYILVADLILPIAIATVCYSLIYATILKNTRRVHALLSNSGSFSSTQLQSLKKELKITKVMFAVYLGFVFCYLPFSIVLFIMVPAGFEPSSDLLFFCAFMVDLNSSINPVLYPIIYVRCRRGYYDVMCRRNRVTLISVKSSETTFVSSKN